LGILGTERCNLSPKSPASPEKKHASKRKRTKNDIIRKLQVILEVLQKNQQPTTKKLNSMATSATSFSVRAFAMRAVMIILFMMPFLFR
jgi:hypothetical protein